MVAVKNGSSDAEPGLAAVLAAEPAAEAFAGVSGIEVAVVFE